MSHLMPISDTLYEKLAHLAKQQGQPLEGVLDSLLSGLVASENAPPIPPAPLDWQSASVEEIIADLRKHCVEREYPIDL